MWQQKWHPVKSAILTNYAVLCWVVTVMSFADAEAVNLLILNVVLS